MMKKLLATLLTLCMLLSVIPMMAFPASAAAGGLVELYDTDGTTFISTMFACVQEAIDAAASGQVVRLANNAIENITVRSDDDIILDLDGYVLSGDGTESVITNNGKLTVQDSNSGNQTHNFKVGSDGLWTQTTETEGAVALADLTAIPDTGAVVTLSGGVITGGIGKAVADGTVGGGIYNATTGTVTMTGGNIAGNTASLGGGMLNYNALTLTDTNIIGNTASLGGGGIYSETLDSSKPQVILTRGIIGFNQVTATGGGILASVTLTSLSGTTVIGNCVTGETGSGAGIQNECSAVFNMNGGSITGNIVKNAQWGGAGVCNTYDATFNLYSGKISGNTSCASYYGGAGVLNVAGSGSTAIFNMYGGEISGNNETNTALSTSGAGVCNAETFNLYGGKITGNTAAGKNGGGVYNYNIMTMTGGEISGNEVVGSPASGFGPMKKPATGKGGGVYNNGIMTMTGGKISGNRARLGGAGVENANRMTVGGTAVVTDNALADGTVSNLYISYVDPLMYEGENYVCGLISIGTKTGDTTETTGNGVAVPAAGMNIGITTEIVPQAGTPVQFTGNGTKADEAYFFADNPAYADKYNANGYLELVTGYAVTCADCTNGSVSVGNRKSAYDGETVKVQVTPDEGYAPETVTIKDVNGTDITTAVGFNAANGTFTMPAYEVTVEAAFQQAAASVCYIDANDNGSFDGEDVKYATITAALAATKPATETAAKPTVIRMIADSTENVTIPAERYITLDLNGYVLSGDGTASVITNNGKLTIEDSNSGSRKAYFTYNSDTAWVYIAKPTDEQKTGAVAFENMENDGVTLTSGTTVIAVSGGCITGGTFTSTAYNAGIYNASGATLNLTGGYVVGTGRCNPSKKYSMYGGGICNFGTIVMSGGAVCGNSITGDSGKSNVDNLGGGIYNEGALTISAGSVCYNVASNAVNNYRYGDGGGIYNWNGTLTISGTAEISNNTADYGGGVFVYGGTFTMDGGTITGNKAYAGGGVYVYGGGTFNMSGTAEIRGNTADYGGGICNYGTLKMSGTAEISENKANYGGGVYQLGTMTIGGTAVITGNTKLNESGEDTGDADNLLVVTGYTVTIGTKTGETEETKGNGVEPLAKGAKIGVNIVDYNDVRISGVITSNGASSDTGYFFSDDASYGVKYNSGNYLELVTIPTEVAGTGYSASLTLNENIDINFKMSNLGTGFDDDLLTITVDGGTWTGYTVKDGVLSGVLKAVNAAEMGKTCHVVVTYDGVQVKAFDYSVADYCKAAFAAYANDNTTYDKLNTLCKALLNYGKWAADYANRDTVDYVASTLNADCADDFAAVVLPASQKAYTNTTADITGGASLQVGSDIALQFTLTTTRALTADDVVVTNNLNQQVPAENITFAAVAGGYTVSLENLGASKLSRNYTLQLKDVPAETFSVSYGVYSYCTEAQSFTAEQGFSDTLKTLCKAIYAYAEAAKAYAE